MILTLNLVNFPLSQVEYVGYIIIALLLNEVCIPEISRAILMGSSLNKVWLQFGSPKDASK
jgi:hypothetical protein